MRRRLTISIGATFLAAIPAMPQTPSQPQNPPLYRVTVVQRQVEAINYQYRSGPTRVNFAGTVLMAGATGEATVESQRGRAEVNAKFEHVLPPGRFGAQYLTYVLWALSPEGAPHNLGEIVPSGSDKASLHVTTDLQAFALIVTAEPYSAVRTPSDVVVMENVVRPDTIGKVQAIRVNYELMPRGHYTWNTPGDQPPDPKAKKVSMREYEAISQVYQAQNAVELARAANVAEFAPAPFAEAERLLAEAKRLQAVKADTSLIIQNARAAAQTAEDAKTIALRRAQEKELTQARTAAGQASTQAPAQPAKVEPPPVQQPAPEPPAAQPAEPPPAAPEPAAGSPPPPQHDESWVKSQNRQRLMQGLNQVMEVRDTPRGLVVTVPDEAFSGSTLRGAYASRVVRVAALLSNEQGLRVDVEGHTDSDSSEALSTSRATEIRNVLNKGGLTGPISARGLGASHLLTSTANESGRIANRRVEIIVSGNPIGDSPLWNHSYRLTAR